MILFSKNKRLFPNVLKVILGGMTLLYPFILYNFHGKIPPLYFILFIAGLFLIKSIIPFLIRTKDKNTTLQKHTLLLSIGVTLILAMFFYFKGSIATFYYPVLVSLGMAGVFAASLVSPPTIIESLARLKEPNLPPLGIWYTRQVTKVWVCFCLLNASISYMTIVHGNLKIWMLYNGFISYILIGMLLVGELIFRYFYKRIKQEKILRNITPLSKIYKKDKAYWQSYWNSNESIFNDYPRYIMTLIQKINETKAERVFLITDDRALFLAGLLAALGAKKKLVIPHAKTPGLLKELLGKKDVLLTNEDIFKSCTSSFIKLDDVQLINKTSLIIPEIDHQKANFIFYTSGSTGAPKPIYKTLSQLEAEVLELQKTWPMEGVNFYSMVPPHHLYGLLFSILWPVCTNQPLNRFTLSHWGELSKTPVQNKVLISSLAHIGRFPDHFDYPIQYVFSSGGLLSFKTIMLSQKHLKTFPIEVYGSTETGGIAYRQQNKENAFWNCFPKVQIKVDDKSKLYVKSPYLRTDDFEATSDIVVLENKAQFSLKGREDRIVKIEGKRVCLIELEKKLDQLSQISDVKTLMLHGKTRDEIGAVLVLSKLGKEELLSIGKVKFIRILRRPLQSYFDLVAVPRRWRFVEEIPRNAQGKTPISLLKPLFENEGS